jgi:hypothetical protein
VNSINKEAKVNKRKSEVKLEFSGENLTPYGYGSLGSLTLILRKVLAALLLVVFQMNMEYSINRMKLRRRHRGY